MPFLRPFLKRWILPLKCLLVPTAQERAWEANFGVMPLSAQWQFLAALCAQSSLPNWYPVYCAPLLYGMLDWTLTACIAWYCLRVWRGLFTACVARRRRRKLLRHQGAAVTAAPAAP